MANAPPLLQPFCTRAKQSCPPLIGQLSVRAPLGTGGTLLARTVAGAMNPLIRELCPGFNNYYQAAAFPCPQLRLAHAFVCGFRFILFCFVLLFCCFVLFYSDKRTNLAAGANCWRNLIGVHLNLGAHLCVWHYYGSILSSIW